MPTYQNLPTPSGSSIDGLRLKFRKVVRGLLTRAGVRLGDGELPTADLDVVSLADTTDIRLASGVGETTAWRLRSNNSNDSLDVVDDNTSNSPLRIQNSAPTNALLIDAAGKVTTGGELEVTGDLLDITNSSGGWRTEIVNGDGRVNMQWNADGGLSPTFIVGGEDAMRLRLHDEVFYFYRANGSSALAGDPITWVEIFTASDDGLTHKAGDVLVKYPGLEPSVPQRAYFIFGGRFNLLNRFGIVNGEPGTRAKVQGDDTKHGVGKTGVISEVTYFSATGNNTTEFQVHIGGILHSTFLLGLGRAGLVPLTIPVVAGDIIEIGYSGGTSPTETVLTLTMELPS